MPTLADYPHLVAQLDRRKNGRVAPESIAATSSRRLIWRCRAGRDHVWETAVKTRTMGHGCPFCSGNQVSIAKALSTVASEIAREWHPTRNGALGPNEVLSGSSRMVWWRCDRGPDHEWRMSIQRRTHEGRGCPFCAARRVSVTNSLATLAPTVARQWHPTKNGALQPRDIFGRSERSAWWKCAAGPDHEWAARVRERVVGGHGCPFCSRSHNRVSSTTSIAVLAPRVAAEWHPTKNGRLTPHDVISGSHRHMWWRCPEGHEWSGAVRFRTQAGSGCPFCSGRRVTPETSLATLAPETAAQWHPTKNGQRTPHDLRVQSQQRVWWKCPKGPDHEWETAVQSRTQGQGTGCPFCANRRWSVTNNLASAAPKTAREWHPTMNRDLAPREVIISSKRYVWWRCQFGHVWWAQIRQRALAGGVCPRCQAPKSVIATTRRRRRPVHLARYEGAKHSPG